MKNLLGRYWLSILITVVIILCFAVLVQIFKETNYIANWLFNFLSDWALVLSASATLLLAAAAFGTIRESRVGRLEERQEERRKEALERIRGWAEETITLSTKPTTSKTLVNILAERLVLLHPCLAKGAGVLMDSVNIDNDLCIQIEAAFKSVIKFVFRLGVSEENIADFKTKYKVEGELKRFSSIEELNEERGLLLGLLHVVIIFSTDMLVMKKNK